MAWSVAVVRAALRHPGATRVAGFTFCVGVWRSRRAALLLLCVWECVLHVSYLTMGPGGGRREEALAFVESTLESTYLAEKERGVSGV